MRLTRYYLPTLKETPADAEVVSHQLMLRAGMIRLVTRGIYDFLPLGPRVVRKIEAIVREEMNRAGAIEVLLPMVQPAELWKETGRWDVYLKEGLLAHLKDRVDRELCLGPTHEEVITDLVRRDVRSWRDLPLNLYQIQGKFRDEIRPRFGLMRAREFLMKDAYSFDRDVKGAHESYRAMYDAYKRIFARCGLEFRPVEAATGAIGGSLSHEFQVLAESGEDAIAACEKCEYAANLEKAEIAKDRKVEIDPASVKPLAKVATPAKRTIDEVAAFLDLPPSRCAKTLVYETEKGRVMALVRGDHHLNEEKLKKATGSAWVQPAKESDIVASIGPVGFLGPIGAQGVTVIADRAVENLADFVTGANEADRHYVGANHGRDFQVGKWADLRMAQAGDRCPRCAFPDKETGRPALGGTFAIRRGIEVGHVFYLGTKYSTAMKATIKDESGKEKPIEMGCYGIGVTRVAAAAIEQNHDANGIVWPTPLAPFQALVIAAAQEVKEVAETAEAIYQALVAAGIEALYDDRAERAGFKFKDADLVGIPYRVVVGDKNLKEGMVETKVRRTGEVERRTPDDAVAWVVGRVRADLRA